MCALRDAAPTFSELNVKVYGISSDDVATQAEFAQAQKLEFALLSDPDGSAGRKYGVLREGAAFPRRVTFVIDDQGVLRHADEKVDVSKHGADLAEVIRGLRK